MSTMADFIAAFTSLSITGVNTIDHPPASLNSSRLPVGFPIAYQVGTQSTMEVGDCPPEMTRTCIYMLALEAVGQGTQSQNHALYTAHLDNFETALNALTVDDFMQYTYRTTSREVAGIGYWGVIAEITGSTEEIR